MPETAPRTDAINVQEIMEQIRTRIRETRGSESPDGPPVRSEAFVDPKGLLARLREARPVHTPAETPTYTFEDYTLFESHRGPLRFIRKLLAPILKLFFNPNPLIQALNTQARINQLAAERDAAQAQARTTFEQVQYEVMHAMVVETARLTSEMKQLSMQMASLTSRLEFNEKRARAIEGAVVYRPAHEDRVEPAREPRREERETRREEPAPRETRPAPQGPAPAAPVSQGPAPTPAAPGAPNGEGGGSRSRRRRRRRGRRGGGGQTGVPGGAPQPGLSGTPSDAQPGATLDAADAAGGEDEGDWDAGDSPETPAEPGPTPDRADSDPSDQGQ